MKPPNRSFLLKFTGLVGARTFSMIGNVLALLLVARWVGPDNFGPLAESQSLLLTAAGLTALGIPLFTLRAAALGHKEAVGFALAINLASASVVLVVGVILILTGSNLGTIGIMLMALAVGLEKLQEVRIGLGLEAGETRLVNSMIITRASILLLSVTAAGLLRLSVIPAYLLGRACGAALAAIGLSHATRNWPLRWRKPTDGTMAAMTGFAVGDIVGSIRGLDVWLVGVVGTSMAAGLYGAVNRLSAPIMLLTGSLRTLVLGPAARGGADTARLWIRRLWLVSAGLAVPATVLALLAPRLVALLLGNEFAGSGVALTWLFFAVPSMACAPLVATFLQAHGHAGLVAKSTGAWNLVFLAAIILTASRWGATGAGAALAMVSWGQYITFSLLAFAVYRQQKDSILHHLQQMQNARRNKALLVTTKTL